MRILIYTIAFVALTTLSFSAEAAVDTVRINLVPTYGVGKLPTFSFQRLTTCSKDQCLFYSIEKVKVMPASSYVMVAKVNGKWSFEEDGSGFQQYLKEYAPKSVSIGEGGITVAGVKYPNKKYIVFVE